MPCMLCVYTDVAEVGFTSAKVASVNARFLAWRAFRSKNFSSTEHER
jgi:hypothetical protein